VLDVGSHGPELHIETISDILIAVPRSQKRQNIKLAECKPEGRCSGIHNNPPKAAASMVRQCIYRNEEPLNFLIDISVTHGRSARFKKSSSMDANQWMNVEEFDRRLTTRRHK